MVMRMVMTRGRRMPRWAGSRSCRPGFTLVEALVAIVVMGVIAALSMPLMLGSRRLVQSDQLRTATNQGVRAGSDLIGSDIRMAGERFPQSSALTLPPIEIVQGASGAPDEVILRRNLWENTFPVCNMLLDNTDPNIIVVRLAGDPFWTGPNGPLYPECGQPLDTNGWPMNLAQVKALADTTTTNGVLRGYVYDPANGAGEFINFTVPANANTTGRVNRWGGAPITGSYPLGDRALMYILDERRYRINNDVLELILNGITGAPMSVAGDITDLQALYVLDTGAVVATLPGGTTWRNIRSVEITLTSETSVGPEMVQRSLTTRYFPRNVLSR
jgi:type IV pilus assembly protein PilW